MQVRRFTAESTAAALRRVKRELGAEAVILSTSRLGPGRVEVAAAREPAGWGPGADLGELSDQLKGLGDMLKRHLIKSEAARGFDQRPEVAPLYRHLAEQEVSEPIIAELLDGLVAAGGHSVAPPVAIRIKKMLKVRPAVRLGSGRRALWALVGPTGVGKTTTVAKLAASFTLDFRLKVGLVTVDTYRIAAPEQLKTYGQIMDIPTLVAADAGELAQALEQLADRNLVLIDTVGRSPSDGDHLDELAAVLAGAPGLQTHLVLACPTRESDQQAAVKAFERFDPVSLIFTKLDETATYGCILNRVAATGKPVSYITFGQRVPEDIEPAAADSLARRLMPARPAAPGKAGKE